MTSAVQLPVVIGPSLTAEQAREIYARGEEAVIFAMLELAAALRRAEGQSAMVSSPATPSGMRPLASEAAGDQTREKTGAQGRPRRKSPTAARADRRAKGAPGRVLSGLPRRLATLPPNPHPLYRRHSRRLIKRLRRHRQHLLTFLDHAEVPFDNNAGERAIRPAVIIRKNSYCNRSQRGADTQAVLMSIYRTLKQRGHDPLATITQAVTDYLHTNKLPPLPP
jgi:transposase